MVTSKHMKWAGALGCIGLLAGCLAPTGATFTETDEFDFEAPGLISGEAGAFTLYDSRPTPAPTSTTTAAAAPTGGAAGATATAAATTPAGNTRQTQERILLPDGRVVLRTVTVEETVLPAQ